MGIKLDDARRLIAAAEKKAAQIGQPMNIAVCDEGGNLVSHVRMDGAWLGSIDISIKKAFTSRAFDIATRDLAKHSQSGGQFFGIHASNDGRIMIFAGGIPLKRGGAVAGAIGVSGGSGEQDHLVAEAGAEALWTGSSSPTAVRAVVGSHLRSRALCSGRSHTNGREQSRSLHRTGEGGSPVHRLSEARAQGWTGGESEERGPQMRARRHLEGRLDQHLRQRPAHGARPHHRADGPRARARDYWRGGGDRPGR